LNAVRCVCAILGWFLIALRPNTDLLHKHIKAMAAFAKKKKPSATGGVNNGAFVQG
jgi:hypothetical protein